MKHSSVNLPGGPAACQGAGWPCHVSIVIFFAGKKPFFFPTGLVSSIMDRAVFTRVRGWKDNQ